MSTPKKGFGRAAPNTAHKPGQTVTSAKASAATGTVSTSEVVTESVAPVIDISTTTAAATESSKAAVEAAAAVKSAMSGEQAAAKELAKNPSDSNAQGLYNAAVRNLEKANEKAAEIQSEIDASFASIASQISASGFWCDIPLFGSPLIDPPGENPGFSALSDDSLDAEARQKLEDQMIAMLLSILDSMVPIDVIKLVTLFQSLMEIFKAPVMTWDDIKLMLCNMAAGYADGNVKDPASLNPANAPVADALTPTDTTKTEDKTEGGGATPVYTPPDPAEQEKALAECQDRVQEMLKSLPCALLQYMMEPMVKSTEVFVKLLEGLGKVFNALDLGDSNPLGGSAASSPPPPKTTTTAAAAVGGVAMAADGSGGFLWKPISDYDGKLLVLLPSSFKGKISSVSVAKDSAGKEIKEVLSSRGTYKDGRLVYRGKTVGSFYGSSIYVVASMKNGGATAFWKIPNGGFRVD